MGTWINNRSETPAYRHQNQQRLDGDYMEYHRRLRHDDEVDQALASIPPGWLLAMLVVAVLLWIGLFMMLGAALPDRQPDQPTAGLHTSYSNVLRVGTRGGCLTQL